MAHIEFSLPGQLPPQEPVSISFQVVASTDIIASSVQQEGLVLLSPLWLEGMTGQLSLLVEDLRAELTLSIELADQSCIEAHLYAIRSEMGIYLSDVDYEVAEQMQDEYELSNLEYIRRYSEDCFSPNSISSVSISRPVKPQLAPAASSMASGVTEEEELQPVCISGRITWLDILGNEHPLADTLVELTAYRDGMSVGVYTDSEGRYSIDMVPETRVQDYNLYLHTKTHNCYVSSAQNVMRPYYVQLFKYKQLEPGTFIEGQDKQIDTSQKVGPTQDLNKQRAFSIAQAINVGHEYVHRIDHSRDAHDVTHLCYPNRNASKTSYCSADGSYLSIYDTAFCAWDLLLHEFGHWLQSRYEFLDTPGGSHASSADDIEALGDKDEGIRQAWCESWPTVFAILSTRYLDLQGFPYVNDLNYDANNTSDDDFWNYSLEDEDRDLLGEGCERSVMQVLFEMHDPKEEGLNLSDEELWRLVTESRVTTFSQFVTYALAQGIDAGRLGESLSRHGMAARDLTYSAEQKTLRFVMGGNHNSALSLQDTAQVRGIHPITQEVLFELPATVEGTVGKADLSAVEWPAEGLGLQVVSTQSHEPVTGPYPSQCLVVADPTASATRAVAEEKSESDDELLLTRSHFDSVRGATATLRSCSVAVGGQMVTLKTKRIKPLAEAIELTPGAELHFISERPLFGLCAQLAEAPDETIIPHLAVECRTGKGRWQALDPYIDYASVEAMCDDEVTQFRIVLSSKASKSASVRLTQIVLFGC